MAPGAHLVFCIVYRPDYQYPSRFLSIHSDSPWSKHQRILSIGPALIENSFLSNLFLDFVVRIFTL